MRFVTQLAIRRRVVTMLAIALLLGAGVFTYRNMPVELFPEIEFPLITVTTVYPSAGPDAVVRDVTAPVETAMLGIDGIDSVQSVSSGFLSVVVGSFDFGTDMSEAEQALNASLDAVDFPSTVEPPNAERITPDAFPVLQLGFSGGVPELERLVESSVVPALAGVDGALRVVVTGGTETRALVAVTPEALADSGVSLFQVSQALAQNEVALQVRQYLSGQSVATLKLDGEDVDVVLIGRPGGVADLDGLRKLTIAGPAGPAPLGQIADVAVVRAPVSVTRTDGLRSASIDGAIVAENTQAVGRLVQQEIDALDLPPGVEVVSGGVFAEIAEGFQSIFIAMIAGVTLVYLIMVASLGSLRNPFVIITSLPLALIGALLALVITGRTLGLPALMGILMLIGVVVTNAIVLVDFVERLRSRGMSVRDALIAGGRTRLRPILMTAITTNFALLPLAAFVSDAGGIISAELATVVIGGLTTSTALTLLVVPVVYMLVNDTIPGLFSRRSRTPDQIEVS